MGYDYYGYDTLGSTKMAPGLGATIWLILSLIIALVGCFLVYFLFVNKNNELKNPKLEWLRNFLRFDKMLIETILKIGYIFAAIMITLAPFAFLAAGFAGFIEFMKKNYIMILIVALITIIFGNLIVRIIYEGVLIKIMIWKNTTEIKKSLKKD